MNRRKLLTMVTFTGFAVAAALALSRSSTHPLVEARASSQSPNAEFDERVSALEAQLATVRTLVLRPAAAPPERASAPSTPADSALPVAHDAATAKPSAKERDREIVEATLTTFEATLASGIRDRSWERQSESALASVFTSPALAGSRLGSINCVESLCKIVVQYDRQDHSDPMEVSERVLAPFNAAAFFHHSPSTNETYFYVAREGQPLPNLAPPAG